MAGGQGPGSVGRAGGGSGRRSCHSHAIAIGACLLAAHGMKRRLSATRSLATAARSMVALPPTPALTCTCRCFSPGGAAGNPGWLRCSYRGVLRCAKQPPADLMHPQRIMQPCGWAAPTDQRAVS